MSVRNAPSAHWMAVGQGSFPNLRMVIVRYLAVLEVAVGLERYKLTVHLARKLSFRTEPVAGRWAMGKMRPRVTWARTHKDD